MIEVKQLSDEEWLITVQSKTTTEHRVRLTGADLQEVAAGKTDAKQLLEASFRFLLEREPNTSILSSFDLPVISRYFPEYKTEIGKLFRGGI
ncbi:MAG: hypothetical protein M3119_11605 [Verrucomicrobiota bacterium]|nr:hypothetical protein [Verrucomicrobiota bacterium]